MVYQQGLQGAEFRTQGPVATGGEKQPTFRTARAQRGHSARTAHGAHPMGHGSVCIVHIVQEEHEMAKHLGFCMIQGSMVRWDVQIWLIAIHHKASTAQQPVNKLLLTDQCVQVTC